MRIRIESRDPLPHPVARRELIHGVFLARWVAGAGAYSRSPGMDSAVRSGASLRSSPGHPDTDPNHEQRVVWNPLLTRSVMATIVAITLRVRSGTFQNAQMIAGMRIT